MSEIKVYVLMVRGKRNLQLQWDDPHTGQRHRKSAGTASRPRAEKAAHKLEAELEHGLVKLDGSMRWGDFVAHYFDSRAASISPNTVADYDTAFRKFEASCGITRLSELTSPNILKFAASMRNEKLSEATVGKHLRSIKAAVK